MSTQATTAELEGRLVEFGQVYQQAREARERAQGAQREALDAVLERYAWLDNLLRGDTAIQNAVRAVTNFVRGDDNLGVVPVVVGGAALGTAARALVMRVLTAGGAFAVARGVVYVSAAIAGLRAVLPSSTSVRNVGIGMAALGLAGMLFFARKLVQR